MEDEWGTQFRENVPKDPRKLHADQHAGEAPIVSGEADAAQHPAVGGGEGGEPGTLDAATDRSPGKSGGWSGAEGVSTGEAGAGHAGAKEAPESEASGKARKP